MPDDPSGAAPKAAGAGDRVTLISGASEGIGLALAREFARGGETLFLVARDRDRLTATAGRLSDQFGVRVHVCAADLATAEGCEAVVRAVRKDGLAVEHLVNNAGVGLSGPFTTSDVGDLTSLVDLNVAAPTYLIRRFLPDMIARRTGGILNVGSLGGFVPGPWQAAYYASKSYLLSLTQALARETAGTGVRVSILAPGPVKTGFHRKMGAQSGRYLRFQGVMDAQDVARIGYTKFMAGRRIIVPGAINAATAMALRFVPHTMLTPFIGWLLQPRGDKANA